MKGKRTQAQAPKNEEPQEERKSEKVVRNELTDEQKKEISDAFEHFKENGIQPSELKLAMKSLGFDPSIEESKRILDEVDKQGNKPIFLDNFMDIMFEKPGTPEEEMNKAFNLLCEEGHDKITFASLKKICNDLGENITDEEIEEMIGEADKDQDSEVGQEDFFAIMKKTNMFQS